MNIQSFLEHHGIVRNPFAEEDAQTDQVCKQYCISSAYHPIWDKVYGDPKDDTQPWSVEFDVGETNCYKIVSGPMDLL